MSDAYAPPDIAWTPVSPALATLRRIMLAVATTVLAAVLVVVAVVLGLAWGWWLLGAGLVVVAAATGWVLVGRNARWWGYAERDEDLYVKHGALFRRLVVVPYGRMQYVDVQSGPLERAFRVATVHLHTASPHTSARIPGLPAAEAARLRDRLTSLGESQAAGL